METPNRKITFQFMIDLDQYHALKQYKAHTGVSIAILLRELVDDWMRANKEELAQMGVKEK